MGRLESVSALLPQAEMQPQDSGLALAPEAQKQMQDTVFRQMQDPVIALIPQAQMQMQLMPQAQMQMQDSVPVSMPDSVAAIIPVQTGQGINMWPSGVSGVFVSDYDGNQYYYPVHFSGGQ